MPRRRIWRSGFATIQAGQQHRAGARINAGDLGTDVSQQPAANGGGRRAADLNYIKSG
jgi:hypothetical protein